MSQAEYQQQQQIAGSPNRGFVNQQSVQGQGQGQGQRGRQGRRMRRPQYNRYN